MKRYYFSFLWVLLASVGYTVQTMVVDIDHASQYQEGEALSTAITSKGTLRKGVAFQSLVDFKDKNLWSSAFHRQSGEFIVGTGPQCEIYAVAANGKERFLAKLDESDVYAIAVNAKGDIFAGTSPKGKIYKLNPKGDKEIYFEPNEEFIWDLQVDKDGVLYAATGNQGKIYKITAKGQGEVYFDSDETGIRSLALDNKSALLAGSSDNGLLYRITAKNTGVVLLEAGKGEIKAITLSSQGQIYVAANAATSKNDAANAIKAAMMAKALQSAKQSGINGEQAAAAATVVVQQQQVPSQKPEKSKQIVGKLYRIDGNFYPENIWNTTETIQSALWNGDHLLVGTGSDGYLYKIEQDRIWSQIGKVEAEQITSLTVNSNQKVWVTTSNSGRVWEMSAGSQGAGVYKSKAYDSNLFADWGRILVEGNGKWTIRTRSGNTSNPDKSWNAWTAVQSERVSSPSSRYLQFEISIESGEIDRVRLFYLPQNQPPVVKKIVIVDPGVGFNVMQQPVPQPQTVTAEQLLAKTQIPIKNPDRYQPILETGMRTVVWQASDPEQDHLGYKIEIREQGGDAKWQLLKDKWEYNLLSWSTSGWPEGSYVIRVTANDATSNLQGKGLVASLESSPFLIDHTPPQFFVDSQKSDVVRFVVTDKVSLLSEVEVSEDGVEYRTLLPIDGPLDDRKKTFEYKRTPGKPFFIRATDEAGNVSGIKVEAVK